MKGIIAAALTVAMLCADAAHAQESRSWSSPDGVFSVRIPEDWQVVPHASQQDSENRSRWLSFSRRSASGYNRCDLWKWNERRSAPVTQGEINARVPRSLEAWSGGPEGMTVREFSSSIEEGVAILRAAGESSVAGVPTHRQFAVFVVVHTNTMTEYTLTCDLTQPASLEDVAAAAAFSNSITFNH